MLCNLYYFVLQCFNYCYFSSPVSNSFQYTKIHPLSITLNVCVEKKSPKRVAIRVWKFLVKKGRENILIEKFIPQFLNCTHIQYYFTLKNWGKSHQNPRDEIFMNRIWCGELRQDFPYATMVTKMLFFLEVINDMIYGFNFILSATV